MHKYFLINDDRQLKINFHTSIFVGKKTVRERTICNKFLLLSWNDLETFFSSFTTNEAFFMLKLVKNFLEKLVSNFRNLIL